MVDACTLAHPSDEEPTLDETTGAYVPDDPTVYYTGPCRVQKTPNLSGRNPVAGEHEFSTAALDVSVPASVLGCAVDDIVTIITSVFDPDLTGRVMRVEDVLAKSYATARRLSCTELTA